MNLNVVHLEQHTTMCVCVSVCEFEWSNNWAFWFIRRLLIRFWKMRQTTAVFECVCGSVSTDPCPMWYHLSHPLHIGAILLLLNEFTCRTNVNDICVFDCGIQGEALLRSVLVNGTIWFWSSLDQCLVIILHKELFYYFDLVFDSLTFLHGMEVNLSVSLTLTGQVKSVPRIVPIQISHKIQTICPMMQ